MVKVIIKVIVATSTCGMVKMIIKVIMTTRQVSSAIFQLSHDENWLFVNVMMIRSAMD
jgi:hypothetical protein